MSLPRFKHGNAAAGLIVRRSATRHPYELWQV
jgi:hypothetical protein